MEISEVRVKLVANKDDRLKAFCSMTLDNDFVVRDIKVIEGKTDKLEIKTGDPIRLTVTVQNTGTIKCDYAVITIKMAGEVMGTTRIEELAPAMSKEIVLVYKMDKKGTYTMTASVTEAHKDTIFSDFEVQSGSFKVADAGPTRPSVPGTGTTVGGSSMYLLPIIAALVIIGPTYVVLRNLRNEEKWLEEMERMNRSPRQGPKDQ